jgi:hypothetical protein
MLYDMFNDGDSNNIKLKRIKDILDEWYCHVVSNRLYLL